jgi:hypothetical protein
MKTPVLLRSARAAQRSVGRKVFQFAPLARNQSERLRRLALATGLGGFWGRCFLTGQTSGQIFETPSGEPRQRLGAIKAPFGFEIGKIVKFAGLNSDQLDLILGTSLARLLRIEPKPSAAKTMDITQI